MARKYQRTQELLPQIKELLAKGMTQKEVADKLGLTGDRPIHELLKRERRKTAQGISKQRGRKPAKTLQEYKYENKRLKMEAIRYYCEWKGLIRGFVNTAKTPEESKRLYEEFKAKSTTEAADKEDESSNLIDTLYMDALEQNPDFQRWTSEYGVFHIVKGLYPDAIYQYHCDWLGKQSIDVYIPSIKTGIEYQGIQHYQPVEHFGGEESYKHRVDLDKQKKKLCKDNGVKLGEISYLEDISLDTVKNAIKKAK